MMLAAASIRLCVVPLFLSLVATVSVQHGVAETALNEDPSCTIQNDDVDGNEIFSRLLLADDFVMPQVPRQQSVVQWRGRVDTIADIFPPDRPGIGSRAPPPRPFSV